MTKVSLRIYNRDIESLVDQGQIPEAIAHCQHILKTFPKHLDTYRLLGKAYLEVQRFGDAADIFQRVLMSVPDDFVSHVGMSIIRDDEKNLSEAIWHMERAFEAQPSNAAVQGELRRLYGRRDGMEPPKIRMTRGALAHMYFQGQLYAQAIAEIRAVLTEEPQRIDMQTLLAKAYFFAGQRIEATELSSGLLKKYPYSLDANRVMLEILPGTDRANTTQVYRHKVNQLNPYAAFATGSLFELASVPDAAVSLERFIYVPGQDEPSGVEWTPSTDEQFGTERKEDDAPDWLTAVAADEFASTPEMSEAIPNDENDIPDFLKEAGWKPSTGEFQEGSVDFSDESEEDLELAPADIPDWLQGMAPDEPEPEPEISQEELDFLSTAAAPKAAETGEVLGWLESAAPADDSVAQVPGVDETPDWMKAEGEITSPPTPETVSVDEAEVGDIPDWLGDLGGTEIGDDTLGELPVEAVPTEGEVAPEQDGTPEFSESLPEGIDDLGGTDVGDEPLGELHAESVPTEPEPAPEPLFVPEVPTPSSEGIGDLGMSTEDQDSAMAWLESLAAKQGAREEELLIDPSARTESAPEWVEKAKAATGELQPSEDLDEPIAQDLIAQELESEIQHDHEPLEEEETPAWINELPEIEPPVEEEPVIQPSSEPESTPELEVTSEVPAPSSGGIGDLGMSTEDQDSAMAWLESLAAKQGAKEEELIVDPSARRETAPDWVEKAKAATGELQPSDVSVEPVVVEPEMPMEQSPVESMPESSAQVEVPEQGAPMQIPVEEPADTEESEISFDWAAEEETETESIDASGVTSWLQSLNGEDEEPVEVEAAPETTPELPSWISDESQAESTSQIDDDLPDWLRDEQPSPAEPEVETESLMPTSPTEWQPAGAEEELLAEVLPELAELDSQAAEAEVEAPVAEIAQVESEPEPMSELQATENQPPADLPASTPTPTLRRTGMLGSRPQDETLLQAQTELQRGNLQAALDTYSKMIKKNRLLEEVIYDLRDATYRYPVDVTIWQTLGDAYMRANRLQDALDAYTKAEELLR